MAKQVELLVDGLFAHALGVMKNRINPRHALAAASIVDTMIRASAEESKHQRYQKKTPKVKFFDSHITEQKAAEAVEEVVKQAAATKKLQAEARRLLKLEVEEKSGIPQPKALKKDQAQRKRNKVVAASMRASR
jgi:hypothetical protein